MNKTKVLIVDDSIFMRKALEGMLNDELDIEVVGLAHNGEEGVEMAARLKPDIITMDIEMPRMDGITALQHIMKSNPTPVIMVSSLTKEGADATLKALELGAVDFIPKNNKGFSAALGLENDLKAKIRKFASNKGMMKLLAPRKPLIADASFKLNQPFASQHGLEHISTTASKRVTLRKPTNARIVAIGTSTGGPQSLQKVIPLLPENIGVPIVVTQHMPPNFTQSLANRLDTLSKLTVVEAQGKERLEPNVVYIAKGGMHLTFKKVGTGIYTDLSPEPSTYFNIPSVDVMLSSATEIYGSECLGVIMTGMGADGTKGLQELKHAGGTVIAQNEQTCIVYGMPRSVVEAGIADEIVPLEEIYERIIFHTKH